MNRPSYEYMAEMYEERIKRLKADHLAVVAEKEQEYKSLLEHHETQTKDFKEQIATLTNKFRSLENDYVQQGAIYEGISDILRDGNTSDFMLSFEIVRQVSDLRERACCLPCNSWGHTDSCIRNNVAALTTSLAEKDVIPDFARGFRAGEQSVLRTNRSGCCCKWDDKDEGKIVSLCGAHKEYVAEQIAALEAERDRLREALEEIAPFLCRAICPTTWKTGEARPHDELCVLVQATLKGRVNNAGTMVEASME